MDLNLLEVSLIALFAALTIAAIFRRFQVPVLLSYFIVGALIGPHALGLAPDIEAINRLTEFGIVFLMFAVGLGFSHIRLTTLRYPAFVVGALQVFLCVAITAGLGILIGIDVAAAVVLGAIVAMSSTAIIVKQLSDQRELHTPHGITALGVLLFQDLAVIPIIILIAALSQHTGMALTHIFMVAFAKGLFAIAFIFLAGKWLLRPLFYLIAKSRSDELFTLTVLFITLSSAWITDALGLSLSLGAFLAGIMLAETSYRHQIDVEIRPFKDILLGLFFISIGMLADVQHWYLTWQWIALLLFGLVIGKMLLLFVISRLCGYKNFVALRTSLILAQGSEFGFVILSLAVANHMMPPDYGQVILAALLISFAISPIMIHFNSQIASIILPKSSITPDADLHPAASVTTTHLNNHIIICGNGSVGRYIANILDKINHPYLVLEIDPDKIPHSSPPNDHLIYGNASHPAILSAAGIEHAKAIILSFDDTKTAIKIIDHVRQTQNKLLIIARCKDQIAQDELSLHGANIVVSEVYEESIALATQALHALNVPANQILDLTKLPAK